MEENQKKIDEQNKKMVRIDLIMVSRAYYIFLGGRKTKDHRGANEDWPREAKTQEERGEES